MPLVIFHLNHILLFIVKMNKEHFLFHMWKIRVEGRSLLKVQADIQKNCILFRRMSTKSRHLVIRMKYTNYLITCTQRIVYRSWVPILVRSMSWKKSVVCYPQGGFQLFCVLFAEQWDGREVNCTLRQMLKRMCTKKTAIRVSRI